MVHPELGSKRHAVRKGDLDSPLYWVGNDEDWREVRRRPRVALECPERCGVELVSVETRPTSTPLGFSASSHPGRRVTTGSLPPVMADGRALSTTG